MNVKKCKEMIISFLREKNDIPRLQINELPLDLVSSFKVLGITINNKLNWQDNTNVVVKIVAKQLHIIRVLKRCSLPPNDLLLVYFSLVRSTLSMPVLFGTPCYQRIWLIKLKKFKRGPFVSYTLQFITRMLLTLLLDMKRFQKEQKIRVCVLE